MSAGNEGGLVGLYVQRPKGVERLMWMDKTASGRVYVAVLFGRWRGKIVAEFDSIETLISIAEEQTR